jgi:tetratricopeptide (TPR) repeat protein
VGADPSLKLAWYQKGVCHQMMEQVDEAVDAFSRGLALDRRDAGGIHFKIAAMRALKGDRDGALDEIGKGLAINKPNFHAELYRIEYGGMWGDPRWEAIVAAVFEDTGFQHTKKAQAEVGFSWGLFEHGSVLFYDSLSDAFAAAEAYRREGDVGKAREFYEKLVELLDRERHPLKAGIVRGRLASLPP